MDLNPLPGKVPDTQPAFSGGPPDPPPRPPKLTARDVLEPNEPGRRIWIWDYIEVKELAEQLRVKPFRVVAELMQLKIFKYPDESIDFATAARIAQLHGCLVERVL